jgi:hypothetical protein
MNARKFLAAAALFLSACRAGADLQQPVDAELARVEAAQKQLETGSVPDMVKESVAINRQMLDKAKAGTTPLVRLYRLRNAATGVDALLFTNAHLAASKSIADVEALWKERKPAFDAPRKPGHGPLLQRALVEAAENRAEKLFRASLPYGRVDGPMSGLYYLGEAEATAAYGRFVASIELDDAGETPPSAAALQSALDALETETLKVYEQDQKSPIAMSVSGRLKEARELLERGSLAGATLLLLESRLALSRASKEPPGDAPVPADLPNDSMAELFRAIPGEPLIRRDVLPLYAAMRRTR